MQESVECRLYVMYMCAFVCACVRVCIHQPCKLLNGAIPAQVAMCNIAVRYHRYRDGHI